MGISLWVILTITFFLVLITLCTMLFVLLNRSLNKIRSYKKHETKLTLITSIFTIASVLIMAFSLFLSSFWMNENIEALNAQIKGTPQIDPDLSFSTDFKSYYPYQLIGLTSGPNNTFIPVLPYIDIIVINNGQREASPINYQISDKEGKFVTINSDNKPVKGLNREISDLQFRFYDCYFVTGVNEYNKAIKEGPCDYTKLKQGLLDLYLRVDCATCNFNTNPQCYRFNVCILGNETNQQECEAIIKNTPQFVLVTCPKNRFWT